jgi:hypothetical protein
MPKPSPKAGKQEMEAEAYAAGYAAAAAGYFHLPLTPAKTPTQASATVRQTTLRNNITN